MKKIVTTVLVIALLATVASVFLACSDDKTGIDSYEAIENKIYKVGDKYASSDVVINAKMKDGTTRKVNKNLVFVGDSADTLKLDADGKFTTVGTYEVTIYALEEREDLKIGVWTIEVKE